MPSFLWRLELDLVAVIVNGDEHVGGGTADGAGPVFVRDDDLSAD